jgi:Putative zinc-finger
MTELEKIHGENRHDDRFSDLCALSFSGDLSAAERAELDAHLKVCPECCEEFAEFSALANEGFPSLASVNIRASVGDGVSEQMVESTRRKLFAATPSAPITEKKVRSGVGEIANPRTGISAHGRWAGAIAAAVLLAVGISAVSYRLGQHTREVAAPVTMRVEPDPRITRLGAEKVAANQLALSQAQELDRLRENGQQKEKELAKLQVQLNSVEEALHRAAADKSVTDVRLQEQRDSFAEQIRQRQQAYNQVQTELLRLKSEREKTLLRLTSLEQEVDTLSAARQEDLQRIKDQEEYLASDRDIRELMGARQLFIADIFDIAADRTRKPFGRVFYTKGKSLVFYAFDLDRQAHLKNASSFQVWGQKGRTPEGALNLGILYMDNEANRRWALRLDDPAKLQQIDAVFVTIEPHGGSERPSGKPFLYAYLKKDANHP